MAAILFHRMHGDPDLRYAWIMNGREIKEAAHLCSYIVKAPGAYSCITEYDGTIEICDEITIFPSQTNEKSQTTEDLDSQERMYATEIDTPSSEVASTSVQKVPQSQSQSPSVSDTTPAQSAVSPEVVPAHELDDEDRSVRQEDASSSNVSQALIPQAPIASRSQKQSTSGVTEIDINHLQLFRGKVLGQGSCGVVFKGEWAGTPVSIKEINVKRKQLGQMSHEVNVTARVRHPNIITLMGYAYSKKSLLLVSELVEGNDLDTILFDEDIKQVFSLDHAKKMLIAIKITQAIAYLHNLSPAIVHRDIKPANILVDHNALMPKLCDLGISILKQKTTRMTMVSGVDADIPPGTPAYMAPDSLLSGRCNSATDVYSWGVSLLEMFAEDEFWPEDFEQKHIIKFHKEKRERDLSCLGNLEIKEIVKKCLSIEARDRPTALDILNDLNNIA